MHVRYALHFLDGLLMHTFHHNRHLLRHPWVVDWEALSSLSDLCDLRGMLDGALTMALCIRDRKYAICGRGGGQLEDMDL